MPFADVSKPSLALSLLATLFLNEEESHGG